VVAVLQCLDPDRHGKNVERKGGAVKNIIGLWVPALFYCPLGGEDVEMLARRKKWLLGVMALNLAFCLVNLKADEIILLDGSKKSDYLITEIVDGKVIIEKKLGGASIFDEIKLEKIRSINFSQDERIEDVKRLKKESELLAQNLTKLKKEKEVESGQLKKTITELKSSQEKSDSLKTELEEFRKKTQAALKSKNAEIKELSKEIAVLQEEKKTSSIKQPSHKRKHKPTTKSRSKYTIVKREDLSYQGVVRLQFRIRVPGPLSKIGIRNICNEIIAQQKRSKPHNAIAFLFYLPDSSTNGLYTAGQADWAPYGKWGRADDVSAGEYSKHKLVIKTGGALGSVKKSNIAKGVSKSKRKKIFYDLTAAQDRGVGDEKSYGVIAKKYGVSVGAVRKIVLEGVLNGWPMP